MGISGHILKPILIGPKAIKEMVAPGFAPTLYQLCPRLQAWVEPTTQLLSGTPPYHLIIVPGSLQL